LREYTNRFFENRNTCVSVRDDQVVDSYKKGLRDRKVFEKIHESGATKVASLMEVVNKLIDTEEALVNQFDHNGKQDAGTSGAAGDSGSKFRKRPSEVLVADGRRPSTFNVEEFNVVLDSPCTFHEGGTHTVRECQQFKRAFRTPEDPKRPRSDRDRSSSRRYNNSHRDDRRGRQDNDLCDDRRRDNHPPEDRREERDLPPPLETGNPNGPFQLSKRSINMIVGGLKSSTSRTTARSSSSTPNHHSPCVGRSSPLPSPELITGSTSRTSVHTRWSSSPSLRAPCSLKPSSMVGVDSTSSSSTP
jgi:hypothetical protein